MVVSVSMPLMIVPLMIVFMMIVPLMIVTMAMIMAVIGSVGFCHRPPKLAQMTIHAAHPYNRLLLSIQ